MPVLVKNQNRFRKVYPGIRKTAAEQALYPVKIEAATITLTNESTGTYTFSYTYSTPPAVVLNVSGGDESFTTAYITSISTTAVTFETGATVSGQVHVQVIEVTS